jgi:hypothetical protein
MADGWCWFVLREEYCWLVAGGWFVVREKYCWLVADKPSEQGEGRGAAPPDLPDSAGRAGPTLATANLPVPFARAVATTTASLPIPGLFWG